MVTVKPKICKEVGCNRKHSARGYCINHYIIKFSYPKNREKINTDKNRAKQRSDYRKVRLLCLNAYSNNVIKCACCGENHIEFLGIDHINGGGLKHRREIKTTNIYWWLKNYNFPKGFRVLCNNCNMSLGFNGYCPHNR